MENALPSKGQPQLNEGRSQISQLYIKSHRMVLRIAERDILTPGKGKFARLIAARERCVKASRYEELQALERRIRQMSIACDLSEEAVRVCEHLINRIVARLPDTQRSGDFARGDTERPEL